MDKIQIEGKIPCQNVTGSGLDLTLIYLEADSSTKNDSMSPIFLENT